MKLTDEIIVQALNYDKNFSFILGIGAFVFGIIALVILFSCAGSWILEYFKKKKWAYAFANVILFVIMAIPLGGAPFYIGVSNMEQYKYYNASIEGWSFGVLKAEIEDKKLDNYSWVLKDFGTIEVSKNIYHNFEGGEQVYIVYIPYKDGKYAFTDWVYSADDYERE